MSETSSSELLEEHSLRLSKFGFLTFAQGDEVIPILDRVDERLIRAAKSLGADVLVFCDRPWMGESVRLPNSDPVEVALLSFNSYDEWFSSIKNDERNAIRKCNRQGVEMRVIDGAPSAFEAQGILDIFREDPFRGGAYFRGYHFWDLKKVTEKFITNGEFISIIAIYDGKIIGVARVRFKEQVAVIKSMYLSMATRGVVRGVVNALLATQIQMLSTRGVRYLVYGVREIAGNVNAFQKNNRFRFVTVNYNCLLLTRKAKIFGRLRLHRPREIVNYKLQFLNPMVLSVQRRLPIALIQKLHLYT